MNLENVEYGIANHIARIEMKRPEVLNALSKGMFRDLKKAFGLAAQDDDARVVEITGAGKAFSAGLDIREVGRFKSRTEAKQFVYGLVKPFWDQLFKCEKPVIALVDGPAYGAGAEIALASDMVVASTLEKIIRDIMHVSPVSNSSFKRIRRTDLSKTKLETAYRELLRTITSEDFREGSSAFVAKRAPEYYR